MDGKFRFIDSGDHIVSKTYQGKAQVVNKNVSISINSISSRINAYLLTIWVIAFTLENTIKLINPAFFSMQ